MFCRKTQSGKGVMRVAKSRRQENVEDHKEKLPFNDDKICRSGFQCICYFQPRNQNQTLYSFNYLRGRYLLSVNLRFKDNINSFTFCFKLFETKSLTLMKQHISRVYKNTLLKRILTPKKEGMEELEKLHNKELFRTIITRVNKSKRMRRTHVSRVKCMKHLKWKTLRQENILETQAQMEILLK